MKKYLATQNNKHESHSLYVRVIAFFMDLLLLIKYGCYIEHSLYN